MKEFKFDYDEENDDLFIYLDGAKSGGAVELGDLVLDFDAKGNLAAIEVIEAPSFFSKLISNAFEISKIKSLEVEIINFRNMNALRLKIITPNQTFTQTILVPKIVQESPALMN